MEEFLEELDALTKADGDEPKDPDSTAKVSPDPKSLPEEVVSADGLGECPPAQAKPEVSSPRGSEKRVRFSEELIQKPPVKQKTASQESGGSESKGSLNASSPKKIRSEGQRSQPRVCQNSEAGPSSPSPDTEHTKNESKPAEKAKAAPHEGSLQPVERTNISNTNTGIQPFYNHIFAAQTQIIPFSLIYRETTRLRSVCSEQGVRRKPPHTHHQQ